MGSRSHGNTWNARRNQAMELAKDFERDCPDVRITVNDQTADYFVSLNHIEVGFLARNGYGSWFLERFGQHQRWFKEGLRHNPNRLEHETTLGKIVDAFEVERSSNDLG